MSARAISQSLDRLLREQPPRATSLTISVFGDAVAPHGGRIWLGSLIRWLAPFGINPRAVRTAVQRLSQDSWFRTRSVGRRSDYLLTEVSRQRFADAERKIYAAEPPAWDGSWCIVVLSHGGLSAARRDAARRELRWHGFGELSPAVLVHPSPELAELVMALRALGLERAAIVLRAQNMPGLPSERHRLRELVSSAWDLGDLAGRYSSYVRHLRPILERVRNELPDAALCFRLRVFAIHEYRRILLRDPELPAELLPADWVGGGARALCAELYRLVAERAEQYVQTSGETAAGPLPEPAPAYYRRFGGWRTTTQACGQGRARSHHG
jgi:phenylacetic acid degradation operon negative regulatory protein